MTVSWSSSADVDIDDMKRRLNTFLRLRCLAGLFGVERGGHERNTHLQGVIRLVVSSGRRCSNELKKALGWMPKHDPAGSHILTKALTGKALHTWIGMIGYCTKDEGQPHFSYISHNITQVRRALRV